MKCPKCNSHVRLKMTGAVCDNYPCTWSTSDRTKLVISKEINNSKIGKRFAEDMMNDLPDMMDEL